MFYGCKNLSSLNLSNFNTKNATDMECLFYGCQNLRYIDIKSLDTKISGSPAPCGKAGRRRKKERQKKKQWGIFALIHCLEHVGQP